jgi:hypothetical protein
MYQSLMTGFFDHSKSVEKFGLREEIIEPELVEGKEAGGVRELSVLVGFVLWFGRMK